MLAKRLVLKDFRNYNVQEFKFSKAYNIIYGSNAQGKTNILEALFMCAAGRSHRTNKDSDLIRNGSQSFTIELEIERTYTETEIKIHYDRNGKKAIAINSKPVKKLGELMGKYNAVLFSPEDLSIIKEGPSLRRRFIDVAISQIKPSYFYDLQQYLRVVAQRNSILKMMKEKKIDREQMEIWDENLAKSGARIISERLKFVNDINVMANKNHKKISDKEEELELRYLTIFGRDIKNILVSQGEENKINNELVDIEQIIMEKIKKERRIEIERGTTTIGPHRDDLEIIINGMNARQFASQGQQRTAIIAMKMSEIDIIKQRTGEAPVLLLDDVMSELDEKRKRHVSENLENMQVFITCTEVNRQFEENGMKEGTRYYKISEGRIMEGE